MPAVKANDKLLCVCKCYLTEWDQLGEFTFRYNVASIIATPDIRDVANALAQAFRDPIKAWLSPRAEYVGVGVRRYEGVDGPTPEFFNSGFRGVGVLGTEGYAGQVSGMVRLRGEDSYAAPKGLRFVAGRCYIPFPGKDNFSVSAAMTDAAFTRLGAIADVFGPNKTIVGIGGTANLTLGVKVNGGVTTFLAVTGVSPVNRWATQRRRGEFGALNPIP